MSDDYSQNNGNLKLGRDPFCASASMYESDVNFGELMITDLPQVFVVELLSIVKISPEKLEHEHSTWQQRVELLVVLDK